MNLVYLHLQAFSTQPTPFKYIMIFFTSKVLKFLTMNFTIDFRLLEDKDEHEDDSDVKHYDVDEGEDDDEDDG